jgi:hypothetical protein
MGEATVTVRTRCQLDQWPPAARINVHQSHWRSRSLPLVIMIQCLSHDFSPVLRLGRRSEYILLFVALDVNDVPDPDPIPSVKAWQVLQFLATSSILNLGSAVQAMRMRTHLHRRGTVTARPWDSRRGRLQEARTPPISLQSSKRRRGPSRLLSPSSPPRGDADHRASYLPTVLCIASYLPTVLCIASYLPTVLCIASYLPTVLCIASYLPTVL